MNFLVLIEIAVFLRACHICISCFLSQTNTNRFSQVSQTTNHVLANSWVCYHRAPRGGLTGITVQNSNLLNLPNIDFIKHIIRTWSCL